VIDDLDAWFVLIDRIQSHDRLRELVTRSDLDEIVARSWVDLQADSRVGVDDSGELRAWGRVVPRPGQAEEVIVGLPGGVDPSHRSRGVGRELLSWQVERGRVAAAELADADRVPRLGSFVEDHHQTRRRLFEAAGFVPTRWFTELSLDVSVQRPRLSPASAAWSWSR
jgi:GNAT superfamily N-acetyltransferase